MEEDSVENSEEDDIKMPDISQEALMKLMLADPGLFREFLDAHADKKEKNSDPTHHTFDQLQTFCDWKTHLHLLLDSENENNDTLFSTNETNKSSTDPEEPPLSSILSSTSDISFDAISPYMLLDLVLIERDIQKRKNNINIQSNQEKLNTFIKDGAYDLKGNLYKQNVRYFDEANNDEDVDTCQQMLSDGITLSLTLYHQFLTQINMKNSVNGTIFNKSYSVFHLMQKIQQKNEYNRLVSIFEDVSFLSEIPDDVINFIAQYSCTIHGKCVDSGAVHFIYCALMPCKEMYERLWFVKRIEKGVTFSSRYFEKIEEMGEIVHIFEPCHCDPRFTAEGRFNGMDIMLYYKSIDTYCIVGSDGVETVDFEVPSYFNNPSK
eukprot:106036_1